MVTFNSFDPFLEELVIFLRNQDVFTIAQRAVTTVTEEFDGTGAQTDFTLTNDTVRNVRSVTVDAAAQVFGTDYTVAYVETTTVVTFLSAPASGTDNVDIAYDYATDLTEERVYPGFPKRELSIDKFPRIGFDYTSIRTEEVALGGGANQSIAFIDLVIDGANPRFYLDAVRAAILNNKKAFFYSPFITVTFVRVSPTPVENLGQEITRITIELKIHFDTEV